MPNRKFIKLFSFILVAIVILSGCSSNTLRDQGGVFSAVSAPANQQRDNSSDYDTAGSSSDLITDSIVGSVSGSSSGVAAGSSSGVATGSSSGMATGSSSGLATDSSAGVEASSAAESVSDSATSTFTGASRPYIYAEPMYNLPRDHVFTFKAPFYTTTLDERGFRAWNWREDFAVFLDDQFKEGSAYLTEINFDKDNGVITIGPGYWPALLIRDASRPEPGKDWGHASKYRLVQYRDMDTGALFDKPLVTVFTIKRELSAPTARFGLNSNGYAYLEWDPVPGADKYIVYKTYEDNDTGLSWADLSVVGETSDTQFSDFEREYFQEYGDPRVMNEGFSVLYDFDPYFKKAYCVMAVSPKGESGASNLIYIHDFNSRLPYCIKDDLRRAGDPAYGFYDSARSLPSYALVEMCDSNVVPMVIDYQSATYSRDINWNNYLEIHARIIGADFKHKLSLYLINDLNVDARTHFQENLSFLTDRQEKLTANASYSPPANKIDYTPPVDAPSARDNDATIRENIMAVEEMTRRINENEIRVYANSALSEYFAMNMLLGIRRINITAFNEARDMEYLENALYEAIHQNPLIGPVDKFAFDYSANEVIIEYDMTPDEMRAIQIAVIAEVSRVVSDIINDRMTDLEKEIAINRYLLETAEYDMEALELARKSGVRSKDKRFILSFTPYGVLINRVGVCASYAGAFKLLGDAAGLDVIIVTGYLSGNLPHAWNRVRVDGHWMTIDPTSNDSMIENVLFNVPDKALTGVLIEDKDYLMKPVLSKIKGTSDALEWYRISDKYYSYDSFKNALARGLRNRESFSVRTDYDVTEEEAVLFLTDAVYETGVTDVENYYYWLGAIRVEISETRKTRE